MERDREKPEMIGQKHTATTRFYILAFYQITLSRESKESLSYYNIVE